MGFKSQKNADSKFYISTYFELDLKDIAMHQLGKKGARNDMKFQDQNFKVRNSSFKNMNRKNFIILFSTIDHLITLHQRKCDELKKMKKFMLQNMFI